jgi:hypothetical protein
MKTTCGSLPTYIFTHQSLTKQKYFPVGFPGIPAYHEQVQSHRVLAFSVKIRVFFSIKIYIIIISNVPSSAAIVQSGSSLSPFACSNKHPAYYGYKVNKYTKRTKISIFGYFYINAPSQPTHRITKISTSTHIYKHQS